MKYSLRSLMIAGILGPPVLAFLYAMWSQDTNAVKLAPVKGVVRLNGKPVAGATIYFTLEDISAIGITDQSGEYQLTYNGRVGCPLGRTKVWIEPNSRIIQGGATIPAQYTDLRQTPLAPAIDSLEAHRIDFDLTSPQGVPTPVTSSQALSPNPPKKQSATNAGT